MNNSGLEEIKESSEDNFKNSFDPNVDIIKS